jgi:hypothetical protein
MVDTTIMARWAQKGIDTNGKSPRKSFVPFKEPSEEGAIKVKGCRYGFHRRQDIVAKVVSIASRESPLRQRN